MNLYLLRYDVESAATFLVKANTSAEAIDIWLQDRKAAGCDDLNPDFVSWEPISFSPAGVAEITDLI